MKYLKYFKYKTQYESYIETDYSKPNVSYIVDNKSVNYNPLKKKKPSIKAIYNAVDDGDYGMMCYNYGLDIESFKIDGVDPTEPLTDHKCNFEINTSNITIDQEEWTAECPDDFIINAKIKQWVLKPKDNSIILSKNLFNNRDIVYGYIYMRKMVINTSISQIL